MDINSTGTCLVVGAPYLDVDINNNDRDQDVRTDTEKNVGAVYVYTVTTTGAATLVNQVMYIQLLLQVLLH